MSTTARKQREREEREALFLDTAAELIESEGLLKLQMARLAEACEYATGTLYQHFVSKEDLLVTLAARNAQTHLALFETVGRWQARPRDKMFALSVVDRHYALHYPSQCRLTQYIFTEAVWENATEHRRRAALECSQPIAAVVSNIVQEAIDAGDLDPGRSNTLELALGPWCLCQGMQTLVHTRGLLEAMAIHETETLLYQHIHTLLNGMGWQPLVDVTNTDAIEQLVARIEHELLGGHQTTAPHSA